MYADWKVDNYNHYQNTFITRVKTLKYIYEKRQVGYISILQIFLTRKLNLFPFIKNCSFFKYKEFIDLIKNRKKKNTLKDNFTFVKARNNCLSDVIFFYPGTYSRISIQTRRLTVSSCSTFRAASSNPAEFNVPEFLASLRDRAEVNEMSIGAAEEYI